MTPKALIEWPETLQRIDAWDEFLETEDQVIFSLEQSNKLRHSEKNGVNGVLRASASENLLDVNDDWSAIQIWLKNKFANKKNSQQQYLLQAERLLLWSLTEKEKPISSLTIEDFKEYFCFLDNPIPQEKWCMPKGGNQKRWDKDWRPFTGPLSASSKGTAINCINTMLNYWVDFGYLKTNVLRMIDLSEFQKARENQRLTVLERALSLDEWQAIQRAIKNRPEKTEIERQEKIRLKFLLQTFLVTALRREELASLQWSQFGKLRGVWRLQVVGKGNKAALIVLPDSYIEMANRYRALFDYLPLSEKVEENEERPVFFGLRAYKALSGNTINSLIKCICMEATRFIEDKDSKERLQKASAHWIRHTAATVLDDKGVDKELIKTHLRHESSSTTELYIHKNIESIKIALESLVDD